MNFLRIRHISTEYLKTFTRLNGGGSGKSENQRLLARNEVIREALISNPADASLASALSKLCFDVLGLIFDREEERYHSLVPWKTEPIIAVCKSLVEISRHAGPGSRSLYFLSQRLLFDIAFHLFCHPDYSQHFERDWGGEHKELILTDVFYDLAESQNTSPRLSGDLAAEGAWVGRIFSMLHYKMASKPPNLEGLIAAVDLWKSICHSAARTRPDRLVTLFCNLRDAATSNLDDGVNAPYIMGDYSWYSEWQSKFEKLSPSVSALRQYEQAYNAFFGNEVEEDWRSISERASREPATVLGQWKLEDVYRGCIQASAFSLIGYLFALLAYYKYWDILREIWYCSQPEDAGPIAHVEHDFFSPRSKKAFLKWALSLEDLADEYFFDRHHFGINLGKACVVVLADFLHRDGHQPINFHISNLASSERAISFIKRLLSQLYEIEDAEVTAAFGWVNESSKDLRFWCELRLNQELERVESIKGRILSDARPDLKVSSGDRQLLYDAWKKTHETFWSSLSLREWVIPRITRSLLQDHHEVVLVDFLETFYLCAYTGRRIGGLDFNGNWFASTFVYNLINKIVENANGTVRGSGQHDWILPLSLRAKYRGLEANTIGQEMNLPIQEGDGVFWDNTERPIAISPGAILLDLHEWLPLPWSGGSKPVVVYGFTEFSEKTTVGLSLYFDLKIVKPQGIIVY